MRLEGPKIWVRGSNEAVELKMPRGFVVKIFKRKDYFDIILDHRGVISKRLLWGISLRKEWQCYTLRRVVDEMIENAQVWTGGEQNGG